MLKGGKGKKQEDAKPMPEIKLLLLGAGESGKSTVFKQMRIIHNQTFTDEERKNWVIVIRKHCVENITDLIAGANDQNLLNDTKGEADSLVHDLETSGLSQANATRATALLQTPEFANALKVANTFQLSDSAPFFFGKLVEVSSPEFTATDSDILACRVRTTGVSELSFVASGVNFRMIDVGGQRNERRKWMHMFDDVQAVIFVAALNEYNRVMFEDDTANRMLDALKLFGEICANKLFAHKSIVLFLNKKDLFENLIASTDLSVCFPDYTGGNDFDNAIQFIKEKFIAHKVAPTPGTRPQEIYVHVTCATSTTNIAFVFDAVKESVLVDNISQSGFL